MNEVTREAYLDELEKLAILPAIAGIARLALPMIARLAGGTAARAAGGTAAKAAGGSALRRWAPRLATVGLLSGGRKKARKLSLPTSPRPGTY